MRRGERKQLHKMGWAGGQPLLNLHLHKLFLYSVLFDVYISMNICNIVYKYYIHTKVQITL